MCSRLSFFLVLLLFGSVFPLAAQSDNMNQQSFGIQKNLGQVKDQNWNPRPDVLFMGQSEQLAFHILEHGLSYQLYSTTEASNAKGLFESDTLNEPFDIYRVDMHWINSKRISDYDLSEESEAYTNYYNVARGMQPALFVKDYKGVVLKDIWEGIDLHIRVDDKEVESDWYLKRAADIEQIQIEIKGAEVSIVDGYLVMKTPFGEIREGQLKVLQNGRELSANWIWKDGVLGFEVEKANPDLPLIIDPPARVWGSYFGGTGEDHLYGSTLDQDENLIVCGNVYGYNLATFGAHQTQFIGGSNYVGRGDGIIVKFNSTGSRIWSTYYGGYGPDDIWSVACDSSNNIYFVGRTTSDTGIATSGSNQSSIGGNGSLQDGFLVKLNSNGLRQWGTYIGGSGADQSIACTIDLDQNIYVTGYSFSNTTIATTGAWQYDISSGGSDVFLIKYNSNGSKIWGTYLGEDGMDKAYACAADDSGYVYISGMAGCYTVMGYNSSHQSSNAGGYDAFLSKFDSSGTLKWSTYYGGEADDISSSCLIGEDGYVYTAGTTLSNFGIADSNAYQRYKSSGTDLYISKFSPSGAWLWGSYFGGNGEEATEGNNLTSDRLGNVYITGSTQSSTGIASLGAYQSTNAGAKDALLAKFTATGILTWSTFYGGSGNNSGASLSATRGEDLYMIGSSVASSNLTTNGSFQYANAGDVDGLIVKFRVIESNLISANQQVCDQHLADELVGQSYPNAGFTYKWLKSQTDSITGFQNAGGNDSTYKYIPGFITKNTWYKRVLSQNGVHDTSNTVLLSPALNPIAMAKTIDDTLCFGDTLFVLNQSNFMGDASKGFSWFYADTLIGTGDTLAYIPSISGFDSLQLIVESVSGCMDTAIIYYEQFKVENRKIMEMDSGALCPGDNRLLYTSTDLGMNVNWIFKDSLVNKGVDSFFIAVDSGEYWVSITSREGCSAGSDTLRLEFGELPQLKLDASKDSFCQNSWTQITDTTLGGPSYLRKWWVQAQLYDSLKSIELQLSDSGIHWFVLETQTIADGCIVSDSISVFVKSSPVINGLIGVLNEVRIDSAYEYVAQTQSTQTYTWLITEGSLLSGQGSNTVTAKWNDTTRGNLGLYVQSANGCADSAEYPVTMDLVPVIYQFSPGNGVQGDTLSIEGINFSRTSKVSVGGVQAASFIINDNRHLKAILGNGDDGNVRIETPYGNAELGSFNYQGVSVRRVKNGQIRIYPNPVQNRLNIEIIGNRTTSSYQLYSAAGRVLISGVHDGGILELNISELASGLYFLNIEGQHFTVEKY